MDRALIALAIAAALGATAPAVGEADAFARALASPGRTAADRQRDETSKPAAVLGFFGLKPGMDVLDLVSGGGYYSEILSRVVGPEGQVVAHTDDIGERYHARRLAERYAGDRLPNVRRLVSNPPYVELPSEAFDLILMVLTYHDFYYVSASNPTHPKIDRDRSFEQIRRSLKPGGILAVVDHAATTGTGRGAAQALHRIDEDFAKRDIEAAGFVFDGESDVLRNPKDDRTMSVFDDRVRRRTDRFVYRFVRSDAPR